MLNSEAPIKQDTIAVIATEYLDAIYNQAPCDEGSDDDKLTEFATKYGFNSGCILEEMLRSAADGTLRSRVRAV
jgi:hypothetical protein